MASGTCRGVLPCMYRCPARCRCNRRPAPPGPSQRQQPASRSVSAFFSSPSLLRPLCIVVHDATGQTMTQCRSELWRKRGRGSPRGRRTSGTSLYPKLHHLLLVCTTSSVQSDCPLFCIQRCVQGRAADEKKKALAHADAKAQQPGLGIIAAARRCQSVPRPRQGIKHGVRLLSAAKSYSVDKCRATTGLSPGIRPRVRTAPS